MEQSASCFIGWADKKQGIDLCMLTITLHSNTHYIITAMIEWDAGDHLQQGAEWTLDLSAAILIAQCEYFVKSQTFDSSSTTVVQPIKRKRKWYHFQSVRGSASSLKFIRGLAQKTKSKHLHYKPQNAGMIFHLLSSFFRYDPSRCRGF